MVASSIEFKELESYAKGYVENNRNNNRDNDLGTRSLSLGAVITI